MLYQLSYVGTTGRIIGDLRKMSSVDVTISADTFAAPMNTDQAFCDALVDRCEDQASAQRIAAALVLLASVDDELLLDLDLVPAALRAAFDAA